MKNFYKNELIMSKQLNRRLEPLSISITDEQLLDSDANQLDQNQLEFETFREQLHVINPDITGMYQLNQVQEETTNDEDDAQPNKQKPYVDFDLFYDALTTAKIAGQIDDQQFDNLNEKAKDN